MPARLAPQAMCRRIRHSGVGGRAPSCYNVSGDRHTVGRPVAMKFRTLRVVGVVTGCLWAASLVAGEPTAAERGKKALLEHCYSPPTITMNGFENLWKEWGLKAKPEPAEFAKLLRERYGLHDAPYPNNGLPMGLREEPLL